MATDIIGATDAILSTLKVAWDANAGAIVGGTAPPIVTEIIERDMKPHPQDTGKAWIRAVLRHYDAKKATLNGAAGTGRYRRFGLVWVQLFVPFKDGSAYTTAQRLAQVAQRAYEGKRAAGGEVCFTNASIKDRPPEGTWCRFDVKVDFYWDEIH